MKKGMLVLLLFSSVFVEAQSIKDALFSGKLKNDPGTVIRKGEDLSTKMADNTRKPAVDTIVRFKADSLTQDSIAKGMAIHRDTILVSTATGEVLSPSATQVNPPADAVATEAPADSAAVAAAPAAPSEAAPVARSNNALMKEYVDSVANMIKAEGLANKKIRKGIYYVTVSYAIGPDGKVDITDVFVSPESPQLQSQVRMQLELEPPRLEPVLASNGTPRKVSRKYNFTLTKE